MIEVEIARVKTEDFGNHFAGICSTRAEATDCGRPSIGLLLKVQGIVAALLLCWFVAPALAAGAEGRITQEGPMPMKPRGVVQALSEANLTTDISEPVTELPFRAGEAFRRDDVLIAFDCARRLAELSAAQARQKEAKLVLESNTYLKSHQAIAEHDVEMARVRVEQAAADVDALRSRVERCEFRAPFDGRVAELSIHRYETPNPSQPFMRIVGENDYEIMLIVPSNWLRWLRRGARFDFVVDETGATMPAEVVRIGGQIEPVSQTLVVYSRFSERNESVLPGMSGYAVFPSAGG